MRTVSAVIFAWLFLFGVFNITPALAQTNAGVTVIPAFIEKPADPGVTLNEVLKVTNESDFEKLYYLYKKNITGVESGGVPIFAEEGVVSTEYEMSEWVELTIETVTVPAHERIEIPFTIRVPESASPGSHFAGVFVSEEPPRVRETGAGVGFEVASILIIKISGDIDDSARIRSFSTDRLLYSTKDVTFSIKVENQGNILIRPRGPIEIRSMFGGEPDVGTVNPDLAGVFPKTVRDVDYHWQSDGIGFGRYEAVVALSYEGDKGQKTIDASVIFWIFPMKIILAFIIGFVLIITLGYFLTRYYINRAIMRAAGGRRIVPQRYRAQVGVSRFTFVSTAIMAVIVLFLLIMLLFSA